MTIGIVPTGRRGFTLVEALVALTVLAVASAGLIRATGPVSYDYQFGTDGLLERLVTASWTAPDTLFCAACTTAAVADGELLGIELGFEGPKFYVFKTNLAALAPGISRLGSLQSTVTAVCVGTAGTPLLAGRELGLRDHPVREVADAGERPPSRSEIDSEPTERRQRGRHQPFAARLVDRLTLRFEYEDRESVTPRRERRGGDGEGGRAGGVGELGTIRHDR